MKGEDDTLVTSNLERRRVGEDLDISKKDKVHQAALVG
jgi:hypothetical protein